MRTKILVDKEWYKPVPWHEHGECEGCAFDNNGCINGSDSKFRTLCEVEQEFEGMIFIRNTKEAMAAYVIRKLEGNQEEDEL